MAKLKSLRGAVGSYGRVAAGGIIDVDEPLAQKLLKTERFVRATEADIKAARQAQKRFLAVNTGSGGFPPVSGGNPEQDPAVADDPAEGAAADQAKESAKDAANATAAEKSDAKAADPDKTDTKKAAKADKTPEEKADQK